LISYLILKNPKLMKIINLFLIILILIFSIKQTLQKDKLTCKDNDECEDFFVCKNSQC
jgi:hypothetical protein